MALVLFFKQNVMIIFGVLRHDDEEKEETSILIVHSLPAFSAL